MMQSAEVMWMAGKFPLKAGGTILEIGCGRGIGGRLINERFNPSRLYLSDLDVKMVQKARAYLVEDNHSKIQFCLSDATYLPFGNQRFDAVFGFGFLHHVPQWRKALAEVVRILKTGGAYYLVEFYPQFYQNVITKHLLKHPEKNRFKSPELKQAFQKQNLDLVHTFEIKTIGIIGVGIKTGEQLF
jgi:ubiquinone/menaquinone biosynthesis C-methylase UbiE